MMKALKTVSKILVIIGALNWGLWGFFQFDLVAFLFGGMSSVLSRIVYGLVGLAGIWQIRCWASCCSTDKKDGGSCCR